MNRETKLVSGTIVLSIPTIIYGGYFLLMVLSGQQDHLLLTDFQKSMFRAGHAHAGVLVILALVVQPFIEEASLPNRWKVFTRISFPLSAVLISGGFFAAAIGEGVTSPNGLITILYAGVLLFVMGLLSVGIGLIKK